METQGVSSRDFRAMMLYDFKVGISAAESHRKICAAFGRGVVGKSTVYDWFKRFQFGDEDLSDKPRSGRPSEVNSEAVRQLIEFNPQQTTRDVSGALGCSQETAWRHMRQIGKVPKLPTLVPHTLTERDRERRMDVAWSLLSYGRTTAWLDSIVTLDEKWVLYENKARKLQWVDAHEQPEPSPKAEPHPRKIMLCVWWSVHGVILFELLPPNTTVTAALYCEQLERVNQKLVSMRPRHGKVRYIHDNARPHVAKITREKLLQLDWEILPHPPYSPDISPSDYHLFRSLSNHIRDEKFNTSQDLQTYLTNFFDSKPSEFYRRGIQKLPGRWRHLVDNNGDYVTD